MSDLGKAYGEQLKKQFNLWGSALSPCTLKTMGDPTPDFDTDVVVDNIIATTPILGVLFEPVKDMVFMEGDSRIVVNTTAIFYSEGMPEVFPKDQIQVTATGAIWKVMGGNMGSLSGLHVMPVFQIR